jgi:hypothetical protein
MALQFNAAPDSTTTSTWYNAVHPISAAFNTFGWVQSNDTGQIAWPVSIVNITNAVAASGTCTFTYTLLQGTALRVGNSIKVTNCTTVGLNATYIIQTLPLSTTFTVNTATTVTEAETAKGGVDVLIAITNAVGNGSVSTYTYTNTDGTLINGQSVVITLCTTAGFNGTFTVQSIVGSTFTVNSSTNHASEAETATGTVTTNSCNNNSSTTSISPTSQSSAIYEIWKMGDALQSTFPVFAKFYYSTGGGSGTLGVELAVQIGAGSDGAGNLTAPISAAPNLTQASVGNIMQAGSLQAQSTTSVINYMSGGTSRILGLFYPNGASASCKGGFFNIERSHDSTGADTGSYVSLITIQGSTTTPTVYQISLNKNAASVAEGKLAVITETGTTTGSFGSSTLLCPVFPVVGAVGNPMIGVLVGKKVDWLDAAQISLTLYNTAHTFQVSNGALVNSAGGTITNDSSVTAMFFFRYD